MPDHLVDVKQLQELLHVSERTIFRLLKEGKLQGFKVGREWRFEESDIEDYIKRQRENARK